MKFPLLVLAPLSVFIMPFPLSRDQWPAGMVSPRDLISKCWIKNRLALRFFNPTLNYQAFLTSEVLTNCLISSRVCNKSGGTFSNVCLIPDCKFESWINNCFCASVIKKSALCRVRGRSASL